MGGRGGFSGGIVTARPSEASLALQWLLVGVTSAMLLFHGVGWIATASVFWQEQVTLHAPRIQSAIVIGLALLVLRASSAPRRRRRLVVLCVLLVAAVSFVAVPLPKQFDGEGLMPGGNDTGSSRGQFENRFRVDRGDVLFHSHLGDVAMTALDRAFGRSETSPARAYDTLSRLAGLLFLLELALAAAWHRWSRQSCRYVGLAIATPLCLLYFGYWDLGYLSMAVGVVPLDGLRQQDRQSAVLAAWIRRVWPVQRLVWRSAPGTGTAVVPSSSARPRCPLRAPGVGLSRAMVAAERAV